MNMIRQSSSLGLKAVSSNRFFSVCSRSLLAEPTLDKFFTSDGKLKDAEVVIKIDPIPRPNEPIETKRKRLLYQSRKRGILESDLLLSRFAKKYLNDMTLEEMVEYDQLLDETDWDIYYWATRNYDVTPLPEQWKNSKILSRLQEMSENKEKEVLRMPELD